MATFLSRFTGRKKAVRTRGRACLRVERLEDRTVPSNTGHGHLLVHPGESIQAAVNAAAPGDEIDIQPGIYSETVTVAKPDIALVGSHGGNGVTLVNPGGAANGITVTAAGSDFVLRDVGIQGFQTNGVVLIGVDGFLLSHVIVTDNGDYGLFPIHSTHGVIESCAATGHHDTGIYVGQSQNIVVRTSTAFANVIGIEIENSSDIRVVNNESYDNTAGILVTLLPGLGVKTASNTTVVGNFVHDNNRANFADPDEIEAAVPAGTGILVLGADHTIVEGNRVARNQFTGIAVASTLLLGQLAGLPPDAFADIDPNPDGTRVRGNTVIGNGGVSPFPWLPTADLLWDGSGTDNLWMGNRFDTSVPLVLP